MNIDTKWVRMSDRRPYAKDCVDGKLLFKFTDGSVALLPLVSPGHLSAGAEYWAVPTDLDKAADAIMSARHSDAFDREACVKIPRDAIQPFVNALEELLAESSDPNAVTGEFDTTAGRARRLLRGNLSGGVESRHATSETDLPVTDIRARTVGERLVKSDQHSGSSAPPAQTLQPKLESWPEIAKETRKQLCDWIFSMIGHRFGHPESVAPIDGFIFAAIERSHAAQPQPSKASPLGERNEQTVTDERGCEIFDVPGCMHVEREKITVRQRSDQPPSSAKATDDKP